MYQRYNHVYYVEGYLLGLIAICPFVDEERNIIGWDTNTSRGREVTFIEINYLPNSEDPEEIDFTWEGGDAHFTRLTLKIFDEKVRKWVAAGNTLHFKTDEELQNYYKTTFFY